MIEAAQFNKLQLVSGTDSLLSVQASLEGEYSKHQLLSFLRSGNTLYVRPNFSDNFTIPNDKLSAHKVFAIDVKAVVPAHVEVLVTGKTAQFQVSGTYKKLRIQLKEGYCGLENLGGQVSVFTEKATIFLKQSKGRVTAKSQYGEVSLATIPKGEALINLESVSGGIKLIN